MCVWIRHFQAMTRCPLFDSCEGDGGACNESESVEVVCRTAPRHETGATNHQSYKPPQQEK